MLLVNKIFVNLSVVQYKLWMIENSNPNLLDSVIYIAGNM